MQRLILFAVLILGSISAMSQKSGDNLHFKDRLATQLSEENVFHSDEYFNWCSSIIKGDDGKYHLFYSRWPRKTLFLSWLTHSEVAHAVSDTPYGPWKYRETVLQGRGPGHWDAITAHNPKIKKFGDKYYLYYIATNMGEKSYTEEDLLETVRVGYQHPNWKEELRPNQRIGVAVANSLNGPWQRMDHPLVEPAGPIETLTTNPAITQGKDGHFYLIIKGDKPGGNGARNQVMAVSDSPVGPFTILDKAVIDYMDTEDMSVWYDQKRDYYYGVFHAHTFIGMVSSPDGENWHKASEYKIHDKSLTLADGTVVHPDRLERPFIYAEDGEPRVLSLAVKKGNNTYIVFIPVAEK